MQQYTIYSPQLMVLIYLNHARGLLSYGYFIDRGRLLTKKLVIQGYALEKLKINFRKLYGRYNYLLQHYITPHSQFVCDLVLCWYVLHYTGYDWLYTWYMVGAWPKREKFTIHGHLFTNLRFPKCPCCLECDIYSRLCYVYGLMFNEWRSVISFLILSYQRYWF